MSDQQTPEQTGSAPASAPMSRRTLLKLGSLGAAAMGVSPLLAACGGSSSGSASSSGSSSAAVGGSGGGKKATVRVWTWYTQQQKEFPRLISEFQAKNPNITVENRIFGTPDQFLPALAAAVSAGNPPEIFAPHIRALTYGQQGVSADLKKELGDDFLADFFKSTRDEYTLEGKQYALGWMAQTFGIFYNPDMLSAAGVQGEPETWDDLIAAAAKIGKTGKAAVTVSANPSTSGLDFFLPLLAQVTDDPTYYLKLDQLDGVSYTDQPVIDALTLLQKLVKAKVFQPGVNGTAGDQAEQLFYTGGSAMLFNGSWTPQDLITNAPKGFADKVKVMQTPALKPGAKHYTANQAGAGLAVSETSKNKDAALEFVKFIYSPEQYATTMNNSNSMPSTQSAAEKVSNPVLKQMTSWLIAGNGVPHIPFGNGSSEAGGPLASIYDGSGDPADVAKKMQEAVKNVRG
ncbi:ABC-type glycerol-3-phosphate transport system substrate-binding protein [Motilibacter peucedani]|uniref:ABC-type glycerol-3-phosphate transport system substrate-binding protein n=1 Tax=Motilibacter peucedani TaxID=598650 RepID=A0A420XKK1_9ACTN|nr:sugar ABC transporter substrate-binding protein [Motilibacter peucedani]RKS69191.1 ABC-type glycerol-3-phosphate transport system substrate-binding protein [Motilibacter peucedani]